MASVGEATKNEGTQMEQSLNDTHVSRLTNTENIFANMLLPSNDT